MHWARLALLLLFWLGARGDAEAQITTIDQPAISIERLWLAPGAGAFIGAQDAQILEPGSWSVAALGSLMSRPILFSDLRTGEEVSVPVKLRLGYELAVARGMTPRLQLGLAIPVVAAQDGDRLGGIGLSESALAAMAFSDVRVHGKLRLQPDAAAPFAYGVSMHLALPTGNQNHFAGERGTVVSWMLISSYQGQGWRVAANLALRLRTEEVVLLSPARPHGNEVIGSLAAEWALPASWEIPLGTLAEIVSVQGDGGGASPGELRAGLVAHLLPHARLKVIGGAGYTSDEVGAPAWRFAMVFERTSP
jgi:hypothetical protein